MTRAWPSLRSSRPSVRGSGGKTGEGDFFFQRQLRAHSSTNLPPVPPPPPDLYRGQTDNPMVVPKCSRSGDIIEPLSVPQWFCNCDAMAKKAVDVVRGGEREVALRELKLAKGARRRDSALFGFTSNLFPRRLAPLAKLARGHVVSLAGEHPVSPFLQASASLCLCPGANSRCHHSRSRDWCISRQL